MKINNWTVCIQDRGKWRDVVEKAKTFNIWSCNAQRRRSWLSCIKSGFTYELYLQWTYATMVQVNYYAVPDSTRTDIPEYKYSSPSIPQKQSIRREKMWQNLELFYKAVVLHVQWHRWELCHSSHHTFHTFVHAFFVKVNRKLYHNNDTIRVLQNICFIITIIGHSLSAPPKACLHWTVKTPFNVPLGICGSEYSTEENLEWINYNTEITDVGAVKLNAKYEKN
jgi:hypothetical protein